MPRSVKAFQFWVMPSEGPTAPVRNAIARDVGTHSTFEFTHHEKVYLARDLAWHQQSGILTGTVYLVRSNDLPSAIHETDVEPLPIDDQTNIGEPMCFAYHPEVGAAVVHYAHTGPRHSVMATVVGQFVPQTPIAVEPVIRLNMLAELRQKQFVRGLEFTLTDPDGVQELRTVGGSVSNALSMLDDLGGVTVKVQVTMGHTRGVGLITNRAKRVLQRLLRIATAHAEDNAGVKSLKIRGSDGDEAPVEQLDLLKGREEIMLEVEDAGRRLDTVDLCRRLRAALSGRLTALRQQRGDYAVAN